MSTVKAPDGMTDPAYWYATRNGVLATEKDLVDPDTGWPEGLGTLYPFETTASLSIGFSKFGEMIDPYVPIGMKYRDREIFTRIADVPMENWLNGWLIEIHYKSTLHSPPDRFVWAFALFADGTVAGKDWKTIGIDGGTGDGGGLGTDEQPISGLGGRQTNAKCVTDDIRILQDGPRRSVAVLVTHVYDVNIVGGSIQSQWQVVDIFFTIIFNKVKKNIIIIKDLCYKLPAKEPPMDIKFSNREQVDAGPSPDVKSYGHFWHQKFSTCYGGNMLKTKWILRENDEILTLDTNYYVGKQMELECVKTTGKPAVKGSEKVYVNGVLQTAGVDYDYVSDGDDKSPDPSHFGWDEYWENRAFVRIKWKKTILSGAEVKLQYKNIMKELKIPEKMAAPFGDQVIHKENPESHRYDLAQFISTDKKYVAFKAYWPTLSSYTLDGWMEKFKTIHTPGLVDWCSEVEMPLEPSVPFTIGQWDFMLDSSTETQFRAVEVLGLVDFHDADDYNGNDLNNDGTKENQVDTEVYWQLQEVFNPWDLNDATSNKQYRRLVEYFFTTASTSSVTLQNLATHATGWRDSHDYQLDGSDPTSSYDIDPAGKYLTYDYWYMYCTFAEKVLVDGKLLKAGVDYTTSLVGGKTKITFTTPVSSGKKIKVLYSVEDGVVPFSDTSITNAWEANWEWIIVGRDAKAVDAAGAAMITEMFKNKQMPVLWSGLDMKDVGATIPYVLVKLRTGDDTAAYKAEDETVPCTGRSTLKDDWCRTVPVKSSNMIGIGGPAANMFTRYWNDFTNAYWDGSAIRGLTCWSKNKYTSTKGTTGYAVISTYKDIDGTVGFLVWGHYAEDTYWASWWLWHFGWKLQKEPDCVTDIILKFDYTKLNPSTLTHDSVKYKPGSCFWEVVEALGTISEFDFASLATAPATETKLVYEFEGTFTTATEYTLSFISDAVTTGVTGVGIKLYGCWLIDGGNLVPDLIAKVGTYTGDPNIKLGHWSCSPFFMAKGEKTDDPKPVVKFYTGAAWADPLGTAGSYATFDYVAGTLTIKHTAGLTKVFVKFSVKQPPIHPCSQHDNLPAPIVY